MRSSVNRLCPSVPPSKGGGQRDNVIGMSVLFVWDRAGQRGQRRGVRLITMSRDRGQIEGENASKPCPDLCEKTRGWGQREVKRIRPSPAFILPGAAGKHWTGSPLFPPRELTNLSTSLSSPETHGIPNPCRMNRLINEP
jgi:hypothetical protein